MMSTKWAITTSCVVLSISYIVLSIKGSYFHVSAAQLPIQTSEALFALPKVIAFSSLANRVHFPLTPRRRLDRSYFHPILIDNGFWCIKLAQNCDSGYSGNGETKKGTPLYTSHTKQCGERSKEYILNTKQTETPNLQTTALLRIAYDGTHYCGWIAGNQHDKERIHCISKSDKEGGKSGYPKRRQSRRSRTLQRKGGSNGDGRRSLRTVKSTIQSALAKLFGNVDQTQVMFESCSRLDAGVHAVSLVAQFYCYASKLETSNIRDNSPESEKNEGLKRQRPNSPNDVSNFLPLPFDSDLNKLVFVLNRMLPPDVRIVAASPVPLIEPISGGGTSSLTLFHPTLHNHGKTYIYKFAIGPVHDPLYSQYVWHLDGSSNRAVGMNWNKFCLKRALLAAELFNGSGPKDFAAFRSAFRGADRGRVQSTICTLSRCDMFHEKKELAPSWEKSQSDNKELNEFEHEQFSSRLGINPEYRILQTFTVVITGDRFLYKMVRNIVGSIVAVGCGHVELEHIQRALENGHWDNETGAIKEESDEITSGVGEHIILDTLPVTTSLSTAKRNRTIRRICAPARGLVLKEVHYPGNIVFDWITA